MMYNDITSADYSFADNGFNEDWAIRLKTKYKNVVYCYGKVSAQVTKADEMANMSFQFQILDPADFDKEELDNSPAFKNYIGDVLTHVIQDAFDNDKYRIGPDDKANDSDDNITESVNQ